MQSTHRIAFYCLQHLQRRFKAIQYSFCNISSSFLKNVPFGCVAFVNFFEESLNKTTNFGPDGKVLSYMVWLYTILLPDKKSVWFAIACDTSENIEKGAPLTKMY